MKQLIILLVLVCSLLFTEQQNQTYISEHVNKSSYMNETLYSGYIPLSVELDEYLFFVLYESRNEPTSDPLIIWLQGDCSSGIGMFMENGPFNFQFNPEGRPAFNITRNNHSWNSNASVIYLDFPMGSGFSFAPNMFSYRFMD